MESEGEVMPLQDIGIVQSNVVLRRHKSSTVPTRRNVAIIDGTFVTSDNESIHQEALLNSKQQGENYYHLDREFEQNAEEDSIIGTPAVKVSGTAGTN